MISALRRIIGNHQLLEPGELAGKFFWMALEITQFTYFQQAGGIDLSPISAEITYGLERITAMVDSKESIYDIDWAKGYKYGQVRLAEEQQFSKYSFELAGCSRCISNFFHNTKKKQKE